ncbi:kinase-like protein [Hymenopellis radicata]|nr:kinase-like protein [Hymenopellis radicata]
MSSSSPRPLTAFHRSMSQVSFPEDGSNILLEIDSADKELSEQIYIYEEDISTPLPFGLDFLDVQVGELLPPEADSDWGVVRLDHEADARVQVIRKLGFGRQASVWLAQQYPLEEGNTSYCAIKVFSAYSTSQGGNEMKAVAKIGEAIMTSQSPDQRHICRPVFNAMLLQPTNFKRMPNLERMISVMELCGPSISDMQRSSINRLFPLEIWRNVFRDILKGLQYLHEECGLVHGDIKQGDILLNVDMGRDQVSEYLASEQEKQQYYEPTNAFRRDLYTRDPEDTSSLMRTIREPTSQPMISPLWQCGEFGDPEYNEHMSFKLADFGSAQEIPAPDAKEIPEALTSPRRRAPELVLGLPWNEKADIWALGSTMLEILAGGPIFRGPLMKTWLWKTRGRWKSNKRTRLKTISPPS